MVRQAARQREGWKWAAGVGLCMLGCMLSAVQAQAQTYGWRTGQSMFGLDGGAGKAVTWDPDGAGPQAEVLVVSGYFRVAGATAVSGIAAWDGHQWQALGSGINPSGPLVVWNGRLVAVLSTGATYQVCNWDGAAWQPVGLQEFVKVKAMRVCNGDLVVAASFPDPGVARWDGSQWQRVGATFTNVPMDVIEYNGGLAVAGSMLSAGGLFCGGAAYWDGLVWQPLMGQSGDLIVALDVSYLAVHNGQLIGGGNFATLAAGNYGVATWDGLHWQPMGTGLYRQVRVLKVVDGQLFANSLVWDGQQWQPLPGSSAGWASHLRDMTAFDGKLAFVGEFPRMGYSVLNNIVLFDGSTWESLPGQIDGSIYEVVEYDGGLVALGGFNLIGGVASRGLARFNGAQWQPLGGGPAGESAYVRSATIYNGDLVVAGRFTSMDGVPCNNIARFDGQQWHPMCGGTDNDVYAFVVHDGDLIVGGAFSSADGEPCGGSARWDGQKWHAMGGRIGGPSSLITLGAYNGQLVGAADYQMSGGVLHRTVIWDGQQWQPFGDPIDYPVWAMAVHNGRLFIGGSFSKIGKTDLAGIAYWDGTSWQPVGGGINGDVCDLAVYNGDLIATGSFTTADGATCNRIARWDGLQWHTMGTGLTMASGWPYGYSLAVHGQDLVVGGTFSMAGGNVSAYLASWGPQYPGDINNDGHIDVADLLYFVDSFGTSEGDPGYDPACDLDSSGTVDTADLLTMLANWGQ